MKKRVLSLLLAVMMVVTLVPTVALATNTYDPSKAIAWATNKTEFNNFSGLCASYVSRCLREGGLSDVNYSTPGNMVSYLEKCNYGTTYKINDTNLKKLKAGDVVMVYCSKGHDSTKYWGLHTIFITAVDQSNQKFTYCAKNNAHFCETSTFTYLKNYASYIKCSKCGNANNSVGVFVSMNAVDSTPKQQYTMSFDANGGTGSMSSIVVTGGNDFTIPTCTFSRDGYKCSGWNVRRNADSTWYVVNVGWLTESQITLLQYEKKCYPNSDKTYLLDSSWTNGYSGVSTYTFFAVWEETHTHSYTNKVTAPTCTEKGYTTHTCACGNHYVDTYVDALGHSYKSVVTPASCTSAGYTTYTCSVCKYTYTGNSVSALGHNYVNGVCTRCSATDPDYHTHDYTGVVTAPTCTAKGYMTYTCSCGDSFVSSYTNALGHSYTNGVCDRCGAAEPKSEDGSIIVSTAKARAGSNVTVDISLKDNPGVSAITLAIDYDTDKLELVSHEDGGLTGWFVAKKAVWTSSGADSSYNGVILSLTFKVKEGVEDGTIPVTVSYSSGDIGNNDEESLFPSVVAGGVTVFSVLPGDINGDGNVNSLDLIRLKKYIADDTTELVGSGDVNGDGNVNSLDLIRLKKYIAGSDVELF